MRYCLILWVFTLFVACQKESVEEIKLQLIPQPENVTFQNGWFTLDKNTSVVGSENDAVRVCADLLTGMIAEKSGYKLKQAERADHVIQLVWDTTLTVGPEGYRLEITPEKVVLMAGSGGGLFYGVQTLGQLLTDSQFYNPGKRVWRLPALQISDRPAFSYRGLHLDVSRHFFSKEFVMKCLDLMSVYKLNRLHWHLTDAAGWRVEIKKYPELTERAAWRSQEDYLAWWKGDRRYVTRDSAKAYGGYYTQEEIREVVDYAAKRHIIVIPEIEMPGHSEEVLAVYPQLSCSGKPYQNGEFCIGNEQTFEFIENVLTEVLELFPSEYIHVGGDEASKAAWKKCPKCQKRIREEHLKDEKGLQSYLIRRVGEFLKSKGRKLIGWDEILEGGLAPEATVMSWRGEAGGIEAARMGHDVIMTPGTFCYFDSYQADPETQPYAIGGFTPYLKVYSYHPVPEKMSPAEARHILGAQANLWTEYIQTSQHAEYMLFPRLLALAEVVWSPQEQRDREDFKRRIGKHIPLLQERGVNVFTLSDHVDILTKVDTLNQRIKVWFDSEKYCPEIWYSINEEEPRLFDTTFFVRGASRIKAFIVESGESSKEVSVSNVDYHKGIGKKVLYKNRYSSSYPAAGERTLTDGYRGGLTYSDGRWQGFLTHIDVTVDLDSVCDLSYVSAGFMQLIGPGVYMPESVVISVSVDGKNFWDVARIENDVPVDKKELVIKDFTAHFEAKARYVKLLARKHAGFQFIDEIVIY